MCALLPISLKGGACESRACQLVLVRKVVANGGVEPWFQHQRLRKERLKGCDNSAKLKEIYGEERVPGITLALYVELYHTSGIVKI